ncbi:hypothetical protein RJ639_010909 [Escallonia herrerae]|uniref:Bacterial surface antigen (D15) domain-containing protein n=1 Tax=Escallonia herrerae TaxID=1293975 RepID=A0AA88VLQ2_9ASTE|nr:hypothetical protein RJ639_010909 [Escallonia herrerae]
MVPVVPLVEDDTAVNREEHAEIIQWLSRKEQSSSLFASFGSEYFLSKEEMEELAFGLELSKVNFIWVIRFPAGENTEIKDALPEGFLDRVKERDDCGGMGSSDQDFRAPKLVVEVGVGVGVEVIKDHNGEFKREEVAKVIREVVVEKTGERTRSKARELTLENSSSSKTQYPSEESITIALTATASFLFHLIGFLGGGGRGGGKDGRYGGGSGGGGQNGGFWSRLLSLPALAKENDTKSQEWDSHGLPADIVVQLNNLSGLKNYKLSGIDFYDLRRREILGPSEPFLLEMCSIRPGGVCTKAQLQQEIETLAASGMFDKIELEGKANPDGTLQVKISFVETTWPSVNAFRCVNVGLIPQSEPVQFDPNMTMREQIEFARTQESEYRRRIERERPCQLPMSVQSEVLQMLVVQGKLSPRGLKKVQRKIENWYHDQGLVCARVVNFGNLHSANREVIFEVVEGDITQVGVEFQDKLGNACEGNTKLGVIQRALPKALRRGHVFDINAARQALQNLNALGLFTNIDIIPRVDEENETGFAVDVKLKEQAPKLAEFATTWSIVPGRGGRPTLASFMPGGTVQLELRNIKGLNRKLVGSVATSNFFNPQGDVSFQLEYVHPYLDGLYNPRNRTFKASCFNTTKQSPVFTCGGADVQDVPPIIVDRAGIKATITEDFTRQSWFTYGLVMEEIRTTDETGYITERGQRILPSGGISADGPPTTLSMTGVDRMAFLQANITRDNTKFLNGALVGERNVFQVDQGLGIGTKFPFFNRHQLAVKRFIPLLRVEEGTGKAAPPVLVLHGNYGGCVGDLPGYEAFTLGGPCSVRGYNMGEIGAARNKLELAAEVRIPVKSAFVYAFAEHGNDLWSSKDVKGNPTKAYQRKGQGSSYGVGIKLGLLRGEYAIDHNAGTGAFAIRAEERF